MSFRLTFGFQNFENFITGFHTYHRNLILRFQNKLAQTRLDENTETLYFQILRNHDVKTPLSMTFLLMNNPENTLYIICKNNLSFERKNGIR